jgi:hypothetical protein
MNFLRSTKQCLIVEYGLNAPSYNFFYWIKDSIIIWCGNIDIKEDVFKGFGWPNFLYTLNSGVFFIKSFL